MNSVRESSKTRKVRDLHSDVYRGVESIPTYTSELTPFQAIQAKYHRYLLSDDDDVLPILFGAVAAHRLDGEPSWLLIVAPPSSKKTEDLRLLDGVSGVQFLSDLTDKTLASGLKDAEDHSLLAHLTNGILVFKDFTTVLEMRRDQRSAIVAQLREVYDGKYDKGWGSGKPTLNWLGRISVLAGVTPVIDRYYSVMNVLGQRFMLLRPHQPNREDAAMRALDNCSTEGAHTQADLAKDVRAFFASLPTTRPTDTYEQRRFVSRLANFVTLARSSVERDGRSRVLDYVPEPEMPARFGRQLLSLARGVALVEGHSAITDRDLARAHRVALDSIPTARRAVLEALCKPRTEAQIERIVGYSQALVHRTLEDLDALGDPKRGKLVRHRDGVWELEPKWRPLFRRTFSLRTADAVDDPTEAAMIH